MTTKKRTKQNPKPPVNTASATDQEDKKEPGTPATDQESKEEPEPPAETPVNTASATDQDKQTDYDPPATDQEDKKEPGTPAETPVNKGFNHPFFNTPKKEQEEEQEEEPLSTAKKTFSFKLEAEESDYFMQVFNYRNGVRLPNGEPLSRDVNQFIRQCINFAINHYDTFKLHRPDIDRVFFSHVSNSDQK
jgi:hypothetical protein